jgi:hypothetical protein
MIKRENWRFFSGCIRPATLINPDAWRSSGFHRSEPHYPHGIGQTDGRSGRSNDVVENFKNRYDLPATFALERQVLLPEQC